MRTLLLPQRIVLGVRSYIAPLLLCAALTGHAASIDSWNHLTPAQQKALAPLAGKWDEITPERKKIWLTMAEKFQQMSRGEQQRVQNKMQQWIALSPEQRLAARENYLRSNNLQPSQRHQAWQQYQQLPEQQKSQLASDRNRKNLITNLPTPAESKIKKLPPLKTFDQSAPTR